MMKKEPFEESLKQPLRFWSQKSLSAVRTLLGNETAQMVGFDQHNPHHCYDLFAHTLHTVNNLDYTSSTTLRVAAFFHDVGKPAVAMLKAERFVFYGYATKSAEMARLILERMGYERSEIERICFYIRHHDDFISWVLSNKEYDHSNPYLTDITYDNVKIHLDRVMKDEDVFKNNPAHIIWRELLSLCNADVSAQSEKVYKNGVIIDSMEHKLLKNKVIMEEIDNIFLAKNLTDSKHNM